MSLRQRLQSAAPPETIITVLGERFSVRGLSRSRRSDVFAACRDADGKSDFKRLEGVMLSACVRDPSDGSEIYSEDEWQQWDQLPAGITGPLVAEIMRLNGMDEDDVGREVKNFGTTGNSA